ncbi:MAG: hypothetical protein NVSMB9_20300 [Isosphaeraceae bacterium]
MNARENESPRSRATVEPLTFPTDSRGLVLEPLDAHEFSSQRNAHLVMTGPGKVRGNHFHQRGFEVAVVLGPAVVRVRDADGLHDHEVPEGQAYRFRFPPGVSHAMLNTGGTPMLILSFNTEPHDPAQPDVTRDILMEIT